MIRFPIIDGVRGLLVSRARALKITRSSRLHSLHFFAILLLKSGIVA